MKRISQSPVFDYGLTTTTLSHILENNIYRCNRYATIKKNRLKLQR